MLVELTVENYAVVEKVRVRFHRGLNLLTGETGSGKSIVVDALALLFGARAAAEMVRTGSDRARISGIFEIDPSGITGGSLPEGVEAEDGELILEREILANGKSRAFAGGRPVTAALLREIAECLGDIHGQHDQQQLFAPAVQREMLDAFAGAASLAAETGSAYDRWRAASDELAELERTSLEKLRQADLWRFQLQEIQSVAPQLGEDVQLENERRVLRNVVRLQESASAAYAALYDDPESVAAQLRAVERRLEEVARVDENIHEVRAALQPASIGVEEASHALRDYLGKLGIRSRTPRRDRDAFGCARKIKAQVRDDAPGRKHGFKYGRRRRVSRRRARAARCAARIFRRAVRNPLRKEVRVCCPPLTESAAGSPHARRKEAAYENSPKPRRN